MVVSHPQQGLWYKTLRCWRGILSQKKSSAFPLLSPLCWCAPVAIYSQLGIYINASNVEHLFQGFFSVYSERRVALASQLHIMILPAATVICRAGVSCWQLIFQSCCFRCCHLPSLGKIRGQPCLSTFTFGCAFGSVACGGDFQQTGSCTASKGSLRCVV